MAKCGWGRPPAPLGLLPSYSFSYRPQWGTSGKPRGHKDENDNAVRSQLLVLIRSPSSVPARTEGWSRPLLARGFPHVPTPLAACTARSHQLQKLPGTCRCGTCPPYLRARTARTAGALLSPALPGLGAWPERNLCVGT